MPPCGAKAGIVLVWGYNFGTGSSHEQAARAGMPSGAPFVIAGSFGDAFRRSVINSGLICIESPELIIDLMQECTQDSKRSAAGTEGKPRVNHGRSVDVRVLSRLAWMCAGHLGG